MNSKTRHKRKRRRLQNARARTGQKIVRHKAKSGRTGSVRSKQRGSHA